MGIKSTTIPAQLFTALCILLLLSTPVSGESRSTDGRYIKMDNGVVKDTKTGLMWTQKDSYVDLGRSLSWNECNQYVKKLSTGDYSDWRIPTIAELLTIYEPGKQNKDIFGGKLRLDPVFAESGPYSYWSADTDGDCCALAITFDYGYVSRHHRDYSGSYGVRAVRE